MFLSPDRVLATSPTDGPRTVVNEFKILDNNWMTTSVRMHGDNSKGPSSLQDFYRRCVFDDCIPNGIIDSDQGDWVIEQFQENGWYNTANKFEHILDAVDSNRIRQIISP